MSIRILTIKNLASDTNDQIERLHAGWIVSCPSFVPFKNEK